MGVVHKINMKCKWKNDWLCPSPVSALCHFCNKMPLLSWYEIISFTFLSSDPTNSTGNKNDTFQIFNLYSMVKQSKLRGVFFFLHTVGDNIAAWISPGKAQSSIERPCPLHQRGHYQQKLTWNDGGCTT